MFRVSVPYILDLLNKRVSRPQMTSRLFRTRVTISVLLLLSVPEITPSVYN